MSQPGAVYIAIDSPHSYYLPASVHCYCMCIDHYAIARMTSFHMSSYLWHTHTHTHTHIHTHTTHPHTHTYTHKHACTRVHTHTHTHTHIITHFADKISFKKPVVLGHGMV